MKKLLLLSLLMLAGCAGAVENQPPPVTADLAPGVERVLDLPPGPGNPRNSEGDFVWLRDGRLLFVYTRFTGGGGDDDNALLVSRESRDKGRTWSVADKTVLENEGGQNVMSVSLLRLGEGPLALFYLRKNGDDDCQPILRLSTDEAETWGPPLCCTEATPGYYVVNNNRVVRLSGGRLVIPAACHALKGGRFIGRSTALCFLSDDAGKTWRQSATELKPPDGMASGFQEPGVVELKDGRLMMLIRTDAGCQYRSWSADGGNTWSPAEAAEDLPSPLSPASIARIPSTGNLLLVWNDHTGIAPELKKVRTPITAAVSKDEGKTWINRLNLAADPDGWYCYTAITFADDRVLLGLCMGDRRGNGLARTSVISFPVALVDGAGD